MAIIGICKNHTPASIKLRKKTKHDHGNSTSTRTCVCHVILRCVFVFLPCHRLTYVMCVPCYCLMRLSFGACSCRRASEERDYGRSTHSARFLVPSAQSSRLLAGPGTSLEPPNPESLRMGRGECLHTYPYYRMQRYLGNDLGCGVTRTIGFATSGSRRIRNGINQVTPQRVLSDWCWQHCKLTWVQLCVSGHHSAYLSYMAFTFAIPCFFFVIFFSIQIDFC